MTQKLFDFTHDADGMVEAHREILQMTVHLTQARSTQTNLPVGYLCEDMRMIHATLLELAGLKLAGKKVAK